MRVLLDTNAIIHVRQNWPGFDQPTRDLLSDPIHTLYISPISAVEITIKVAKGKLDPRFAELMDTMTRAGWEELPFTIRHAARTRTMPMYHSDPFDRMIIAQALTEGLPVVTTDRVFAAYGVQVI